MGVKQVMCGRGGSGALRRRAPSLIHILVAAGAVVPATGPAGSAAEGNGAEHWAFTPVARPAIPAVRDAAWARNPIDAFVLARLEARGWHPTPPAGPRALLRRVYLDLIGLPPNLSEQEAFLNDPSATALDGVVDDLLARPGYGERWARQWLDLVRYADTNGYERDATKPFVWRYRDYVIRAFNDDKPFDWFLLEQLAGDELPDADGNTLIATGYYRLGPWDDEPADPKTDRFDQLDDIVSTTSQVFLGLTLGCARCHDHKFDPLTTRDYYRMLATFNPLQRPRNGRTERVLPAGTRAQIAAEAERDRRIAALRAEIASLHQAWRDEFLASGRSALPANVVAALRTAPDKRSPDQRKLVEAHAQQLDDEITAALTEAFKRKVAARESEMQALPTSEGINKLGRDHNWHGFSMWLAGAGVRGGQAVGATDELGFTGVDERCHVSDLHATILRLMGLDHTRLTYFYQGLDQRLTGVRGRVIAHALA